MTEKISIKKVGEFENNLMMNEKSLATIKKYIKEIRNFLDYLDGGDITKSNTGPQCSRSTRHRPLM